MATVREVIQRDLGRQVEGVVKVFDRSALAAELREYVVTDKIEDELKRIFEPDEQVFEWRTSHDLAGRRFATEQEVDEAFAAEAARLQRSAEELKGRIREGYTVVVK